MFFAREAIQFLDPQVQERKCSDQRKVHSCNLGKKLVKDVSTNLNEVCSWILLAQIS